LNASGVGIGQGLITDARAQNQGIANLVNLAGTIGGASVGSPGVSPVSGSANQQAFNTVQGGQFFSDPNLKTDIEEISLITKHDDPDVSLKLYQWSWIDDVKDMKLITQCPEIGFMADQVKEIFPEFVYPYCGFETIDYSNLLDYMTGTLREVA